MLLWTECFYLCKAIAFGGRAFGRLLGHEDGALMNKIDGLIWRDMREFNSLSITLGHSKKMAICKPGRKSLPGIKLANTMILVLPVYRTMRIRYLLFKSPSLWLSVIAAEWTKSYVTFMVSTEKSTPRKNIL
jgi:hypothetical protein